MRRLFAPRRRRSRNEYELFLQNNPKYALGYAAYGYLLSKVGMAAEATKILLRANQLDPDIPLVKNQLGNQLAEQGKPLQAAPYFIAAIKLAPNEPLYHYQLGTLLVEARDDFLLSGEWTRAVIDAAVHNAFQKAAELAPERFEFAYRYAESSTISEHPDWDEALKAWSALEEKAPTAIERQTMRLHAANICLKLGKRGPRPAVARHRRRSESAGTEAESCWRSWRTRRRSRGLRPASNRPRATREPPVFVVPPSGGSRVFVPPKGGTTNTESWPIALSAPAFALRYAGGSANLGGFLMSLLDMNWSVRSALRHSQSYPLFLSSGRSSSCWATWRDGLISGCFSRAGARTRANGGGYSRSSSCAAAGNVRLHLRGLLPGTLFYLMATRSRLLGGVSLQSVYLSSGWR